MNKCLISLNFPETNCSVFRNANTRNRGPHDSVMLECSFIFLNGIGETTERRLWDDGMTHWRQFLETSTALGIGPSRKALYDREVEQAWDDFQRAQWRRVAKRFKAAHHWRLLEAFRTRTVFLDIETTGYPAGEGEITMVGLYGNHVMTTLIRHQNLTLDRLQDELSNYDLIVTFFGSGFDLPYLRASYPQLDLTHAHFDLCFAARRLGLRGGLKHIEAELGLARSAGLQGLDGWDAVNLWHAWQAGDERAGEILRAYNEADVRNLEPLAEYLYQALRERHGPVHD